MKKSVALVVLVFAVPTATRAEELSDIQERLYKVEQTLAACPTPAKLVQLQQEIQRQLRNEELDLTRLKGQDGSLNRELEVRTLHLNRRKNQLALLAFAFAKSPLKVPGQIKYDPQEALSTFKIHFEPPVAEDKLKEAQLKAHVQILMNLATEYPANLLPGHTSSEESPVTMLGKQFLRFGGLRNEGEYWTAQAKLGLQTLRAIEERFGVHGEVEVAGQKSKFSLEGVKLKNFTNQKVDELLEHMEHLRSVGNDTVRLRYEVQQLDQKALTPETLLRRETRIGKLKTLLASIKKCEASVVRVFEEKADELKQLSDETAEIETAVGSHE